MVVRVSDKKQTYNNVTKLLVKPKKNRCLDLRKQNLMFKSSSNKVNQPFYCEYAKIKNSPYSKTNQLYF